MKATSNTKFTKKQVVKAADIPSSLDAIISEGFTKCGDVIFAKKLANPTIYSISSLLNDLIDLTGVECTINRLHIEDLCENDTGYDHKKAISFGLKFIELASFAIYSQFPGESFRFILSEEEGEFTSVVFRFHKIRTGESWLAPDIESYPNGIYTLDTE